MHRRYLIAVIAAGLFGWSASFLLVGGARSIYTHLAGVPVTKISIQNGATRGLALLPTKIPGNIMGSRAKEPAVPPKEIRADLSAMTVSLYKQGHLTQTLPILSKGKPGSPWETPVGDYAIIGKEEKHFSSIGEVWMPYSLHFFGNFFIHGWPTYLNGEPVSAGYSGGCIRLSTDDARAIFEFAEAGTPVIVTGAVVAETNGGYYLRDKDLRPNIGAGAYLAADLENGDILAAENEQVVLPVASITKLMTALVSLEAVNQFQTTIVTSEALEAYGEYGGLVVGEQLEIGDLIYPLLLESSNDAAEVIARHLGREHFIKLMNDKAKAIGLHDTRFVDPSGIGEGNVSTARDLFYFLRYLNQNKRYVLDITKMPVKSKSGHTWRNPNHLLDNKGYLGGKTGKTEAARETIVSILSLPLQEFRERQVALVVLKSEDRDVDVGGLLKYLADNVYYQEDRIGKAPSGTESVSLTFVGDIMLDRGVESSVAKNGAGDFNWLFNEIASLREADILFGNLEGPLSDRGQDKGNLYSFRMAPATAQALAAAGFDALSVANNHTQDWGQFAFVDTLSRLHREKILPVGDTNEVKVIEKNGTKVGFLAATDVGGGGIRASDAGWSEAISRAAAKVDTLVVSYHFGEEYQKEPNQRQEYLAHLAIDNGAKIVIGHHPHVSQPVERYRDGVIAYSLGNFIFDQNFSEETMMGTILRVDLINGEVATFSTETIKLNENFQPHF